MALLDSARQTVATVDPFVQVAKTAIGMNVAAAIRTYRQGYRGWRGAINTDFDPLDPDTGAQPFDAYAALHRSGRVHYNPARATWVLHRLEDVRAALRDTDRINSSQGVVRMRMTGNLVVVTDGEQHARLRKQVQPAFTKRALDSWSEINDRLAEHLVSEVIANPGCDVVERLTIPMPMRLMAAILGVPETDIGDFRRWSESIIGIVNMSMSPQGIRNAARSGWSMLELRRYLLRQMRHGHLKDEHTLLGRLIDHNTEGELADTDLFFITTLLLIAGNETTTNLLGAMFDTYAHHPEQYDMIRDDPDLIPMAVEEHLRFSSPLQNLYRYTCADYQVGETTIPAGSRVMLSFGAANRDPLAFDEPNTFRADRNPRTHVAFGYGAHMCVGAPLSRMEAVAVLRELVTRVKRVTPVGPTTWSTDGSLRGPTHLPIRLETD